MCLAYLLFLFAQVVLPTPFSDIWARDPTPSTVLSPLLPRDTFYTVYPSDYENATQIAETEVFLKSSYSGEDVIQNRNAEGLVSWRITLKDGDTTDQLKAHPGLRTIEPEGHPRGAVPKAKRCEILFYVALAADSNDDEETKKTREFLYLKVAEKDRFAEFDLKGHVLDWGSLALNEAQKAEVENYPGIQKPLEEEPKIISHRAERQADQESLKP